MKYRVERPVYLDSVNIYAFNETHFIETELTQMPKKVNGVIQPFLSLTEDAAQQLMTGLWEVGFRPRDGAGGVAHINSMEAHLRDMRKLVAAKYKVDL